MNHPRTVSLALLIVVSLYTAACRGNGGSAPTSPTSPAPSASPAPTPPPAGPSGATINGRVAGVPAWGVQVSVSGTALTAPVDSQGRFTMTGVPPGTVQLNIAGNGSSASVTIQNVQEAEQVTITVTVAGATATLDTERRASAGKVELEGKITAIGQAARTLEVAGETVSVPPGTAIRHGDTPVDFERLAVGDRIHVRGTPGTPVIADLVLLQNPVAPLPTPTPTPTPTPSPTPSPTPGPSVQLEGRITAVNPDGARTLLVEGTRVSVPAGAVIRHGDTPIDFSALKVGDRVHVAGAMSGAVLVADSVTLQNDNPVSVNANGTVTAMEAGFSCPAIRFTVEGWAVETAQQTVFEKAPCTAVAVGVGVHVKGTVQASGRVLATWVQVDKK